MNDKNVPLAGFLLGYKAQNIATNATSLKYHARKIQELAGELPEHDATNGELLRLRSAIVDLTSNEKRFLETAFAFGSCLRDYLHANKKTSGTFSGVSVLERIIYHYLEIAESTGDKAIADVAVDAAELMQQQ